MEHMGSSGKKGSAGKKVLIVLLSVLLGLLLILLAGMLYIARMLGLLNYVDDTVPTMSREELNAYLEEEQDIFDPDFSGDVIDPEDVVWDMADGEALSHSSVVNILLIGQDARPGEARARSDSMILCSFNKNTKELTVTSFMRDMYVQIPGHSDHKLNAAFAWGGMELLNETLKTNFGIEIDGNFAVDFDSFEAVIDKLGGVDIYLTAAEAKYLGGNRYSEGVNHLDGAAALTYSRIRMIGNGDFERTARQQNVINAVVEKCGTMNLAELNALVESVLPLLSTNLDKAQILGYAAELLPMAMGIKINEKLRIPADGTYSYAWVSGMSVLMPDLAENRKILRDSIYN